MSISIMYGEYSRPRYNEDGLYYQRRYNDDVYNDPDYRSDIGYDTAAPDYYEGDPQDAQSILAHALLQERMAALIGREQPYRW